MEAEKQAGYQTANTTAMWVGYILGLCVVMIEVSTGGLIGDPEELMITHNTIIYIITKTEEEEENKIKSA